MIARLGLATIICNEEAHKAQHHDLYNNDMIIFPAFVAALLQQYLQFVGLM